jgi:hypothetical protein
MLLGKPMSGSHVNWIPESVFEAKCLAWKDFQAMAAQESARVIDTRDNVQKGFMTPAAEAALTHVEKATLDTFRQKNNDMLEVLSTHHKVIAQPFDMLIKNIISKGQFTDQTLLIVDQVGKQVRWLMYHLEAAGYTNYYFLSGGTYDVIGMQTYSEK